MGGSKSNGLLPPKYSLTASQRHPPPQRHKDFVRLLDKQDKEDQKDKKGHTDEEFDEDFKEGLHQGVVLD